MVLAPLNLVGWRLGFRVQGLRTRVQVSGFRNLGCLAPVFLGLGIRFRVIVASGAGFRDCLPPYVCSGVGDYGLEFGFRVIVA